MEESSVKKAKPCAVCEKMTANLLFKDKILDIPICSRKCEHEYLDNLTYEHKEQLDVVRYLDERITITKKRNRIGWGVSGVGVALIGGSFVIADATLFVMGNVVVIFGTLSTKHFEDKIDKLTRLRKRIVI